MLNAKSLHAKPLPPFSPRSRVTVVILSLVIIGCHLFPVFPVPWYPLTFGKTLMLTARALLTIIALGVTPEDSVPNILLCHVYVGVGAAMTTMQPNPNIRGFGEGGALAFGLRVLGAAAASALSCICVFVLRLSNQELREWV
ncbi:hypothetical protein K438DRAFT_467847 [Mycena galopus ATCC 62051]|nr:hypothetical protein K438DRAFT_467847 [Mycena galopus ATCC 62051]